MTSARCDVRAWPAILFLASVYVLAMVSRPTFGQTWNPDPALGNPEQRRHLYDIARRYCDANFDPAANLLGTRWHAMRESAFYAYGLLLTGDPADNARAQAILKFVVAAQDTQPESKSYGAFKWGLEDTEIKDLNSVQFVGLILADVIDLDRRRPTLEPELRQRIESAGRLAVEAAMRRNVNAAYTNIAMLSVALTAAGDKLWAVPKAGAFAEAKLDAIMALAQQGEFSEYLSPTYYGVAVHAVYMVRKFAGSDTLAAKADAAIAHFWKQIAASYHAPTYQLAGPHQRSYGDNMLEYAAILKYCIYLALNGDYPLPDTDTEHGWDKTSLFTMVDLPITPRAEFKTQVESWREWKVAGTGVPSTLRQYREGNFVLGTVNYQNEWTQQRNLVAYWRNGAADASDFKVGMCIASESVTDKSHGGQLDRDFYSQQVRDMAIVLQRTQKGAQDDRVRSTLTFHRDAKVMPESGSGLIRVVDGSVVTYLYPVSGKAATYETVSDARAVKLVRPWSEADLAGSQRVIAYLVVFRPADKAPPVVTDIRLDADAKEPTASAKVDGVTISVTAKR